MADEWNVTSERPATDADASSAQWVPKSERPAESHELTGIDYDIGAPMWVRTQLMRHSNPSEAKAYLDKTYGKGKYGQDPDGKWWVMENVPKGFDAWKRHTQEQKRLAKTDPIAASKMELEMPTEAGQEERKVSVFPSGMFSEIQPGMAAETLPMAGAIAGGVGGGLLGNVPGMIGGTALGGAVGKGLDEYIKYLQGTHRKSMSETFDVIGKEAALQGGMAAAGPVAGKVIGGPLKNLARKFSGVTPETEAMGRKFLIDTWVDPSTGKVVKGVIPPFGSVAPHATSLEFDRWIRNLLRGDPEQPQRLQYMLSRARRVFEEMGLPRDQIEQAMRETLDKSTLVSHLRAQSMVEARVQRDIGHLRASVDSNNELARGRLRDVADDLRVWSNQTSIQDIGGAIEQSISRARTAFGRQYNTIYDDIHAMTGGQHLVERDNVVETARRIVGELQDEQVAVPGLVQRLAGRRLPEDEGGGWAPIERAWTIAEAHGLRNELRQAAWNLRTGNPLTPSPAWHRVQELASEVDNEFFRLAEQGGLGEQVVNALRTADEGYRAGITRFNDAVVAKVVTDVRRQLPVDATHIVNTAFKPGHTESARAIWSMLTPQQRDQVSRVHMRDVLNKSSKIVKDANTSTGRVGEREIHGDVLLKNLTDPNTRSLLNVSQTPQFLEQITNRARELAALDGKISSEHLVPGDIAATIQNAHRAARQIDEYAASNPLKHVLDPDPQVRGRAVNAMIAPGQQNEQPMIDLFNSLHHDSPEVKEIRNYFMRRLLNSVVVDTPTREKRVIGQIIEKELGKYTERQQELLMPGMVDSMKELARDARFLFPYAVGTEDVGTGTSITAAQIKSAMPQISAIKRYAYKAFAGWLADRPSTIGMLVNLQKQDPNATKQMIKWMYRWAAAGAVTGPGEGMAEPDPEQDHQPSAPIPAGIQIDPRGNPVMPDPASGRTLRVIQ